MTRRLHPDSDVGAASDLALTHALLWTAALVASGWALVAASVAMIGAFANACWLATFEYSVLADEEFGRWAARKAYWFHQRPVLFKCLPMGAFLAWLWLAVRSLAANVDDLRFSPTSAVAAFLIPVLNIWRPFAALRELWRASERNRLSPVPWQAMGAPQAVFVCSAGYVIGLAAWGFQYWVISVQRAQARRPPRLGDVEDIILFRALRSLTHSTWLIEDIGTLLGAGAAVFLILRVSWLQQGLPALVRRRG
jgi:hypothetical protein